MSKIVLILGAGASAPWGFPLAWELKALLSGEFDKLAGRLSLLVGGRSLLEGIHANIWRDANTSKGMSGSTDTTWEFLSRLPGNVRASVDECAWDHSQFIVGAQTAIAAALLPFEAQSRKLPPPQWYRLFYNELFPPFVTTDRIDDFAVVTFNYDRSLETFLYETRAAVVGPDKAREDIRRLEVVHVYGSLGPWEGSDCVRYGKGKVAHAAANLSLIRADGEKSHAAKVVGRARRIVSLGFAYLEANTALINMARTRARTAFLTTYLMQPSQLKRAQRCAYPTVGVAQRGTRSALSRKWVWAPSTFTIDHLLNEHDVFGPLVEGEQEELELLN